MKITSRMAPLLERWWPVLFVIIVAGLLQALMPDSGQALRFERGSIQSGQLWRVITGHLIHLGWGHYLMNMLGLLLICGIYRHRLTAGITITWLLVCAVVVSGGLLLFNPNVHWYVGLSGVLHGILVAAAISDLKTHRWESLVILGFTGAKLLWEQLQGSVPGSASVAGGQVVVDAHLYGMLGGLLVVILTVIGKRLKLPWVMGL